MQTCAFGVGRGRPCQKNMKCRQHAWKAINSIALQAQPPWNPSGGLPWHTATLFSLTGSPPLSCNDASQEHKQLTAHTSLTMILRTR